MNSTRRSFLFAGLALATSLTGCPRGPTFVVQHYRGAQRPRDQVAIVRVNGFQSVRLLKIDEDDVAAPIVEDGRLHFEVEPGRHSLLAVDSAAPQRDPPIVFEAKPGKVYRVVYEATRPHVHEVDDGSDAVGADVTNIEALPTPAGRDE